MASAAPHGGDEVKIVTREEWGAQPPNDTSELLKPVKFIVLTSTRTESCSNKDDCIKIIKHLQETHQEAGVPDLVYNFLIGSDGSVYEGRGWDQEAWMYDKDHDMHRRTLHICFIGRYNDTDNLPDSVMVTAAFELIHQGIREGHIVKRYKISDLNFV